MAKPLEGDNNQIKILQKHWTTFKSSIFKQTVISDEICILYDNVEDKRSCSKSYFLSKGELKGSPLL